VVCCRGGFWTGLYRFFERRPGYALTAALVVATGTSTLFSLFWPFPADEAKQLNMAHLAKGGLGALFVWIYVLIWFIVQVNERWRQAPAPSPFRHLCIGRAFFGAVFSCIPLCSSLGRGRGRPPLLLPPLLQPGHYQGRDVLAHG
jgi:hypothetical protein